MNLLHAVTFSASLMLAPFAATAEAGPMTTDASGSVSETVAALSAAIEGAGGTIVVRSQPGEGTEVEILLPVSSTSPVEVTRAGKEVS